MSRCFAFPPPGYAKNGHSGDALVDWIKAERERPRIERAKAKEERRKAKKKEKEGEELNSKGKLENGKKKKNREKRHKDGKSKVKHDHQVDKKERENELQKSDVTEEHQLPSKVYKSSGSTRDSKKRKLQSPSSIGKLQNLGGLHDQKRLRGSGSSCSAPGREKILSLEKAEGVPMHKRTSTSGQTDIQCGNNTESALTSSSLHSGFTELDSQFRYLCLNWNSPPLEFNCSDVDDMEWLFEKKLHKMSGENRFKPTPAAFVNESHNLCRRACYLPEVGIYAFPYTIPY